MATIYEYIDLREGVMSGTPLITGLYASKGGSSINFAENNFEENNGSRGTWSQYKEEIELVRIDGNKKSFCVFFNSERLIEITDKCKCEMMTLAIEGCMKNSYYRLSALPAVPIQQ
ncbi:MAG: hypothetical protein WCX77_01285 [Candidatus Paceibacterota bacterium]